MTVSSPTSAVSSSAVTGSGRVAIVCLAMTGDRAKIDLLPHRSTFRRRRSQQRPARYDERTRSANPWMQGALISDPRDLPIDADADAGGRALLADGAA